MRFYAHDEKDSTSSKRFVKTVSRSALHPFLFPPSQEATACNFSLVHSLGTHPCFSKWCDYIAISWFKFQIFSIDSPLQKMSIYLAFLLLPFPPTCWNISHPSKFPTRLYEKFSYINIYFTFLCLYMLFNTKLYTKLWFSFPAQLSGVNHYHWLIFLLGLRFYALLANANLNSPAPLKISPVYSLASIINFIRLINFIQNFLICSNLDFSL